MNIKQINKKSRKDNKPYFEVCNYDGIEGLYYIEPKKIDTERGEVINRKYTWICSPINLVGVGKNKYNDFFYLFKFKDCQDQTITEVVSMADFGTEVGWRKLRQKGLLFPPSKHINSLIKHFSLQSKTAERWQFTNATGWINNSYLLPNGEIIGSTEERIYFDGESGAGFGYNIAGTVEDWQGLVANYCRGNYSMMLGVACALAGPLLTILNRDSFGIHLYGESSKGKTTILNIANSIYGDPNQLKMSWSTTAIGIVNEAANRNDGLITLDEIAQATDAKNIEMIAYSLFNEIGKLQGKRDGGNKEIKRWKIIALSAGEKDLETQMEMLGARVQAGQLVRLLNLPILDVACLHGQHSKQLHAQHLNSNSKKFYGAVGRVWLDFLCKNKEKAVDLYNQIKRKWLAKTVNVSPQTQRVAVDRFAVLETALNLASFITNWSEDDNHQAMAANFEQWRYIYGDSGIEKNRLIESFRDWINANQGSFRYYNGEDNSSSIANEKGIICHEYKLGEPSVFYILPVESYKEATKGYPRSMANEILYNAGILRKPENPEKGYDYRVKISKRISGFNSFRAYIVSL